MDVNSITLVNSVARVCEFEKFRPVLDPRNAVRFQGSTERDKLIAK